MNLRRINQTKIAASLNPQNLWLLLNAWKAPLSLNLSGKKAPVVDHQGAIFY
ncbi:hypothetical protein NEOC65_000837 [Neochlamydia sp. AcF65]|nr:hypothetical protein [Neochlamydia sp. AcF65]NGY94986.1 hypothetical protein [Neochlamydia sp. AcF84]